MINRNFSIYIEQFYVFGRHSFSALKRARVLQHAITDTEMKRLMQRCAK